MASFDTAFESNKDEVVASMKSQLEKALNECGIVAQKHAKDLLTEQKAVDTGNLRNSVSYQVEASENTVYIGTNVHYAPYVEYGTGTHYSAGTQSIKGMRARPYIKPAFADYPDDYKAIIDAELKD